MANVIQYARGRFSRILLLVLFSILLFRLLCGVMWWNIWARMVVSQEKSLETALSSSAHFGLSGLRLNIPHDQEEMKKGLVVGLPERCLQEKKHLKLRPITRASQDNKDPGLKLVQVMVGSGALECIPGSAPTSHNQSSPSSSSGSLLAGVLASLIYLFIAVSLAIFIVAKSEDHIEMWVGVLLAYVFFLPFYWFGLHRKCVLTIKAWPCCRRCCKRRAHTAHQRTCGWVGLVLGVFIAFKVYYLVWRYCLYPAQHTYEVDGSTAIVSPEWYSSLRFGDPGSNWPPELKYNIHFDYSSEDDLYAYGYASPYKANEDGMERREEAQKGVSN
eukprot:g19482.t1